MAELHLVLGGTASGKSAFALERARTLGGDRVTFVATAWPGDPELDVRIAAHRRRRPQAWQTLDAEREIAVTLAAAVGDHVLLLDSLTLWVAASLEDGADPGAAWERAAAALRRRDAPVIVVSDEVGHGLVPASAGGRRFRDELGRINQAVAKEAETVTLIVAGVALALKARA
ncbi:MAG: bifunctional adenosylcobinamide kinase/adenosylcobinamide-phosphate guanylyltransferase [Chloroflexi bacterium]|nr:MAG: bifunctional adenosylcobinamide kinase/adenosylcobinamide-phosphate guanylyltransferase [Chloroflexota bacterium]